MVKEVAFKFSLAYNDDDFREAVEAFCDGEPFQRCKCPPGTD